MEISPVKSQPTEHDFWAVWAHEGRMNTKYSEEKKVSRSLGQFFLIGV